MLTYNIDPLLQVASLVNAANNSLNLSISQKGNKTYYRETKFRKAGLIQAAMWMLMALDEKRTKQPQPFLDDAEVERRLRDYLGLREDQ
jgi:hypothetical protein